MQKCCHRQLKCSLLGVFNGVACLKSALSLLPSKARAVFVFFPPRKLTRFLFCFWVYESQIPRFLATGWRAAGRQAGRSYQLFLSFLLWRGRGCLLEFLGELRVHEIGTIPLSARRYGKFLQDCTAFGLTEGLILSDPFLGEEERSSLHVEV